MREPSLVVRRVTATTPPVRRAGDVAAANAVADELLERVKPGLVAQPFLF